jgi:hypothetical protein
VTSEAIKIKNVSRSVIYLGRFRLGLLRSRGSAGFFFLGGLTSPGTIVRGSGGYVEVRDELSGLRFAHTFIEAVEVSPEASLTSDALVLGTSQTGAAIAEATGCKSIEVCTC